MRRTLTRIVLIGAAALLGAGGLAACSAKAGSDDTTDVTWDAQALQAIGYTTEDVTAADEDPAATAPADNQRRRHPRLQFLFRHGLHGEATVQTDEGTKTVVAQRGTVTATDATSVTVKSSDGFTLTWTTGTSTKVIVNRAKADLSAITTGTEVGIAGAKDGDTATARIIVVPRH